VTNLARRLALQPARATPGTRGGLPEVTIRPAERADILAVRRLAEASERRFPTGLSSWPRVDSTLVAALPLKEDYVLADLWRPTGDVVQLLELRSDQLRAARRARVA